MWLTTTGDFASGLSPHPLTDFTTDPQLLLLLPFSQNFIFLGGEETEHQLQKRGRQFRHFPVRETRVRARSEKDPPKK